jgi:hypothetical protein
VLADPWKASSLSSRIEYFRILTEGITLRDKTKAVESSILAMEPINHTSIFKTQAQIMEIQTSFHHIEAKALSIEKLINLEIRWSREDQGSKTKTETLTTIKTNIQPHFNSLNRMGQTTRILPPHNLPEMKWDIIKVTVEQIVIMN